MGQYQFYPFRIGTFLLYHYCPPLCEDWNEWNYKLWRTSLPLCYWAVLSMFSIATIGVRLWSVQSSLWVFALSVSLLQKPAPSSSTPLHIHLALICPGVRCCSIDGPLSPNIWCWCKQSSLLFSNTSTGLAENIVFYHQEVWHQLLQHFNIFIDVL